MEYHFLELAHKQHAITLLRLSKVDDVTIILPYNYIIKLSLGPLYVNENGFTIDFSVVKLILSNIIKEFNKKIYFSQLEFPKYRIDDEGQISISISHDLIYSLQTNDVIVLGNGSTIETQLTEKIENSLMMLLKDHPLADLKIILASNILE